MAVTMLEAMFVMTLAFWMYSIAASLARARAILLEREKRSSWAQAVAQG
jgi:heme exporter protein C